jgi:hypothetical protein
MTDSMVGQNDDVSRNGSTMNLAPTHVLCVRIIQIGDSSYSTSSEFSRNCLS